MQNEKYYYSHLNHRRAYRCARYALKPPKPDQKQAYVKEMQKQLMQSKVARDKLLEAFKSCYASCAGKKPEILGQVAYGWASRKLLSKVLPLRQNKAGLFLQCIKFIKKNTRSFESEEDLGEQFHKCSFEPFFYESSYCHVKCEKVFPVNEKGQLVIADHITAGEKKPPAL